nr:hypothetical protein OG690_28360 [Streptomyces tubercidicus]
MTTALPEPLRTRWQPLRTGLVDLFHYDVEEFHLRDGRLLLRGNNGTGKSKVLDEVAAVLVTRWEWDGARRRRGSDPAGPEYQQIPRPGTEADAGAEPLWN